MRVFSSRWWIINHVLVLCVLLLLLSFPVQAQQTEKTFRIGFLDSGTASGSAMIVETFRQELRRLGWIEGKNITIEHRFDEQKPERLPELAAELVSLPVDLIVVGGNNAIVAAKKATATIPIVMAASSDPVELGMVASMARPGSNITGFATLSNEVNTKRLEILKEAVPRLDHVGLLHQVRTISGELQLKKLRAAAIALKLKLEEIRLPADSINFESGFQTAKQKQVKAIMTTATRRLFAERKRLVELAGKYQLPAMYFQKEFVDEGGLMSYGVDYEDLYRGSAHYVDKILKGANPADLPVEQPTKFELVINLKTVKQIGLTIPNRVLERANQVIK